MSLLIRKKFKKTTDDNPEYHCISTENTILSDSLLKIILPTGLRTDKKQDKVLEHPRPFYAGDYYMDQELIITFITYSYLFH